MAEVSSIKSHDSSKIYTTAGASVAGAAVGGVGGYLRKPFLNDGKLSDEFIRMAQENLTDEAKVALLNNSEILCDVPYTKADIEALRSMDLSNEDIMKTIQGDFIEQEPVLRELPEKIKNAKSYPEAIAEVAKFDGDVAKLLDEKIDGKLATKLNSVIEEIKQKHFYDFSSRMANSSITK